MKLELNRKYELNDLRTITIIAVNETQGYAVGTFGGGSQLTWRLDGTFGASHPELNVIGASNHELNVNRAVGQSLTGKELFDSLDELTDIAAALHRYAEGGEISTELAIDKVDHALFILKQLYSKEYHLTRR